MHNGLRWRCSADTNSLLDQFMFVSSSWKLVSHQLKQKKSLNFVSSAVSSISLLHRSDINKQPSNNKQKQLQSRAGRTNSSRTYHLLATPSLSFPITATSIKHKKHSKSNLLSRSININMLSISDENTSPNKVSKTKVKGGKTIEETYQKKTQLEHILLRYICILAYLFVCLFVCTSFLSRCHKWCNVLYYPYSIHLLQSHNQYIDLTRI